MYGVILYLAVLLTLPTSLEAKTTAHPDRALCPVCAIRGEKEKEKVKAHSEYDGKNHYFCSKGCKTAFDKDPTAFIPPEFPRPVPEFTVETLDGTPVDLGAYEGRVVILDFWATWCKPCVDIMPDLQKIHDTYSDKGVAVVGISIDEGKDRIEKIRKFVDKLDVTYPVLSDARQTPAWHAFKVRAIPALFLIDRDRQIVAQWLGTVDHKKIEAELKKHL